MTTPDDSRWLNLDGLDLAPATDAYLTKGADWYRISREQFATVCVERYVDELAADPGFLDTVVRRYVDQLVADLPNAAEHFDLG
jgi:hypothetical protein